MNDQSNKLATTIFCKMLVVYVLLRMLANWSVSAQFAQERLVDLPRNLIPRILFWPSYWGTAHHTLFYGMGTLAMLLILYFSWNYLSAIFFFLFTLNLYRFNLAIANGSDLVLTMMAFWSIGMTKHPEWKSNFGNEVQDIVYTLAIIFCQLQVAGIYLVSGWDKLMSDLWRTGEAFVYIRNYDPLFNPLFTSILDSTTAQWICSWLTIVFELGFVVLVWFRKTRNYVLLTGVVFHLVIIVMLSIPEFGLLMILSYLIFLKDEDYDRIKSWLKPLPG